MMTEIGRIRNTCDRCGVKYTDNPMSFLQVDRADARSVCSRCNDIEEIEQAKELNEWIKED